MGVHRKDMHVWAQTGKKNWGFFFVVVEHNSFSFYIEI